MHVHVGMADPEEAVQVANGLRPHVPLLIALSANSPLWRGGLTGLMSSRVPIFRAFPRVGLPPRFDGWRDFERRVETMSASGMIEDYTYLWYDVRPHPRLGTVEIRAMDSQTRVEHTVALSALVVSLVKLLTEEFQSGEVPPDPHWEILDENRWLAARHGLEAELFDLAAGERRGVSASSPRACSSGSRHTPASSAARSSSAASDDLLRAGNGAARQQMVFEANHDLRELMAEIVATTA